MTDHRLVCAACRGTGEADFGLCPTCHGEGTLTEEQYRAAQREAADARAMAGRLREASKRRGKAAE